MHLPLVVINPNSSTQVTAGIDAALQPLRRKDGPAIHCHTLEEAPAGVQSQQDIARVTPMLMAFIASQQSRASAFVIACFSDPALAVAREFSTPPVFGIGECAVLSALALGQRFGVVAIQRSARERHLRTYGAMGVLERFAGERALQLDVSELAGRETTLARMIQVGRALRDLDQADVLILGCAGMASLREPLQRALGIPVVEPCQAAAAIALGRIFVNWEAL